MTSLAGCNLSVAVHFLDPSHNLKLSRRSERVAGALKQKGQVLGDVATTEVDPPRRILDREALVYGTRMTTAIPYI